MNDRDPVNRVPDDELDFDESQVFYHAGHLFTGVAFSEELDGGLSEITYEDGLLHGPTREWYGNGQLKSEINYVENTCHGISREFGSDGNLVIETAHEYAIPVSVKRYRPDGEVLDQWVIDESDWRFGRLQQLRQERNWPSPTPSDGDEQPSSPDANETNSENH